VLLHLFHELSQYSLPSWKSCLNLGGGIFFSMFIILTSSHESSLKWGASLDVLPNHKQEFVLGCCLHIIYPGKFFFLSFFLPSFCMLGIEPRSLCMLGNCLFISL
jgi:hypothetical protein